MSGSDERLAPMTITCADRVRRVDERLADRLQRHGWTCTPPVGATNQTDRGRWIYVPGRHSAMEEVPHADDSLAGDS